MKTTTQVSRRDFIKTSALLGGGLLISFNVPGAVSRIVKATSPAANGFAPNAYLRVGVDNSIRIILSKVEMGQGIWTTLPTLIAEELDCDWSKIKVEHSPVAKEYTHMFMPMQGTIGSTSTKSEFDRYRMAGATARVMLVEAASKKLGVTPESCRTENGYVISGEKKISYGELATDASALAIPTVTLREPKDWKYIGKSQKRLDTPQKINGQAKFGMDIQFPDLLTAVVEHAPVFGGKVKSFDGSKAKAIKGVKEVLQIPSGVAVIADNYWNAKLGRDALKIEWDLGVNENIDSKTQIEEYRKLGLTKGQSTQQKGDVDTALKNSSKTIDAEFVLPYLSHSPMEPLNCTVKISTDKCEIWTGTQTPSMDQSAVAKLLNLKPEQIEINTPFLGGGFGRRGTFDSHWILEAVQIAKASGKFIKLVWSREDDTRGGYYRPCYLHHATIGLDNNGFPTAWQHRVVGQSVFAAFNPGFALEAIEGVKGSPYFDSVPNHSLELHTTTVGVPILPWRSVGKSHTIFVMEALIDEVATTSGKDPVEFRRSLLQNQPRFLNTLNLAAEKAEWSKPLPSGRFRGVAVSTGNGSYIAYVIEVSITNKKVRAHRVVCAIDCGLAVNPDGVVAQMESSVVWGLTSALYGEITLEKGRVKQSNFHDYKMLRMNEMPTVEVYIVPSTEKLGGAGEPGVPGVAPALTNALFAATGKRIRNLPIRAEDLVKS